jgi:hypothetical protein
MAVVLMLVLFVGLLPVTSFAATGEMLDYDYRVKEHKWIK